MHNTQFFSLLIAAKTPAGNNPPASVLCAGYLDGQLPGAICGQNWEGLRGWKL